MKRTDCLMNKKNKKKKEKIIYYDDNSTITDMSGVKPTVINKITKSAMKKSSSTAKEKMSTFWAAFRMMLFPTAVVLSVIIVLYFVIMFLSGNCA